ncbi:nuclear transport factor 2 family protein [Streptomyces sp. TRM66268-LWL]|uniref:Nuclear transport factor 2 family protein n=1 Tax=Streptomyces polyasparticus TaxID=2767826 RepID=A0ABR7SI03_9ACTN|nr:nuclear transport factor 2 family protein [Streptomyces polyasparticus]MBC9714587.1 nuclear transport factor 2 family protein [Streptomyces polyasparticus]
MTSSNALRKAVETYWAAAEARDWTAFGEVLADDVVYEMPQSRERIRGKERYLQFNREYPGDWHVHVLRIVAEGDEAVSWIQVTEGIKEMYAVNLFTADESGRIVAITDFWPEPYEPPAGREHLAERY